MKVYRAFSSKTCQYTPIFIYGNILYIENIPYRCFTIDNTIRLVEFGLIDLDKVAELAQLYDENKNEFPDEKFMLIDDSNDTEIMCILAALENKNPKTLNHLINVRSQIADVRRLLAMRDDLTPDMLVRLLNKKYKNLDSSDILELVSLVCDSDYSNETLSYVIHNSLPDVLPMFAEHPLDQSLLREIYHLTNNNYPNYPNYTDYIAEKLIANKNTPLDVIEDMAVNNEEQTTNILRARILPQYLYEYLLTKGDLSTDIAILNGTKDGYKFPKPLFCRLSEAFNESKTVRDAILMSNVSEYS